MDTAQEELTIYIYRSIISPDVCFSGRVEVDIDDFYVESSQCIVRPRALGDADYPEPQGNRVHHWAVGELSGLVVVDLVRHCSRLDVRRRGKASRRGGGRVDFWRGLGDRRRCPGLALDFPLDRWSLLTSKKLGDGGRALVRELFRRP